MKLPKGITRDVIIGVINNDIPRGFGLCSWFSDYMYKTNFDYYTNSFPDITKLLRQLGGREITRFPDRGYYWPQGERDQREMFLAFLLTWIDAGEFE